MRVETETTTRSVAIDSLTQTEREPKTKNPVLLLGGGGGTGVELAKLLASEGRTVFVGTRTPGKFETLKDATSQYEGKIEPFIADISDYGQVEKAFDRLGLVAGQTVDYFALAAEGFGPVRMQIARTFASVKAQMNRPEGLTVDFARKQTDMIKDQMTRKDAKERARTVNLVAPVKIARKLMDNGNLNSSSTIIVLDSTISKYAQEGTYPGPWFYYPVGISKAGGSQALREIARRQGATFMDFIAPGITNTEAGNFFERITPLLKALHELEERETFEFPTESASTVARLMFTEINRQRPVTRKKTFNFYVGYRPGEITDTRPANFRVPTIDWL